MAQGSSEAPKDLTRWQRWPRLQGLKWLRARASCGVFSLSQQILWLIMNQKRGAKRIGKKARGQEGDRDRRERWRDRRDRQKWAKTTGRANNRDGERG